MRLELSRQIFETFLNIKFRGNPSSGSLVFPCGRRDEQGDMTKLIVAFRDFARAPKKTENSSFDEPYLLAVLSRIFA